MEKWLLRASFFLLFFVLILLVDAGFVFVNKVNDFGDSLSHLFRNGFPT